jgi:GAF domain-containing protein
VLIRLQDGQLLKGAAHRGSIAADFGPLPIGRGWAMGRAFVDRTPVHVHDLLAAANEFPDGQAMARRLGVRTILATPLMRENEAIGAIAVRRSEVRPFSDKQVALLQTFADQAVIAIENARLLEEIQARTRELQEALEYQTATSEVLSVISRAPSQLQPVFEAIVQTATRLCHADSAIVATRGDDELYHLAAISGHSEEMRAVVLKQPIAADRGSVSGRALLERRTVQIHDALADPEFTRFDTQAVGQFRTLLGVPLLREGTPIGVISMQRRTVEPFTEKQIELVTTFADQAVIAIENARLFEEVQARTRAAGGTRIPNCDERCAADDQ